MGLGTTAASIVAPVPEKSVTTKLPTFTEVKENKVPNTVKPTESIVKNQTITSPMPDDIWVYHYLPDVVLEQIKEEGVLKSAKVVFEEYMGTELSQRALHPWKRIYWAYLHDTKKWLRTKYEDAITDADVYAYLIWRAAENDVGKLDVTAGARAIYFTWTPMPRDIWLDAIAIDAALAEDRHDPLFSDLYGSHVTINLSGLLRKYNDAKIFRVEFEEVGTTKEPKKILNLNHWKATSKEDVKVWATTPASELWANFVPGEDFFRCVPHGAIVLSIGSISKEFIKCIDKTALLNSRDRIYLEILGTKPITPEVAKQKEKEKLIADTTMNYWYEEDEQQDDVFLN